MNQHPPRPTLDEVFKPNGIAVVGVSGSGKLGFAEMILMAHQQIGTERLFAVNPKYSEVFGTTCYRSIIDIPEPVDHVIVNIPASLSLDLLEQCAVKQVKSVHFFTAGFGESGLEDRRQLESEMLKIAQRGGFRIIGPNCVGLFVPRAKTTNMLNVPYDPGSIGFLSQSGGHACNLPQFGALRGLRFSKVVSYGNALDVDEIELLDYFAEDPETEIVGAYLEGLKEGRSFFSVLKKLASRKPVIIYKGGNTEAGLRAAKGHTASMTSSVAVFKAVCRQSNATLVDSLDEMVDVMTGYRFLSRLPGSNRIAILGSGGGPSVLAGDEMEQMGLAVPPFPLPVQKRLKSVLPVDGGIFINPLDTVNLTNPEAIAAAIDILSDCREIDTIVYHLGFHPIGMWGLGQFSKPEYLEQLVRVMDQARQHSGKSIALALRPAEDLAGTQEFLAVQKAFVDRGFPVFHSLGALARALNRILKQNNRTGAARNPSS